MGCHFFLQEIFPTQGLNSGLPHCGQTLNHLSHQGSQAQTPKCLQQAHKKQMEGLSTAGRGASRVPGRQAGSLEPFCASSYQHFVESVLSFHRSDQIRSVAQSCPTLCDPMNHSTPGLPVHHQLPEFTQTQVHRVSDAIQPSHPLVSPSPPAPNPSLHQSLFQ